jgi:DNA polymerase III delta prime subunit
VPALYRTYRPQTFSEVVGQEAVVRTLTNAIGAGSVRQAYLFAGPRGTGVTSASPVMPWTMRRVFLSTSMLMLFLHCGLWVSDCSVQIENESRTEIRNHFLAVFLMDFLVTCLTAFLAMGLTVFLATGLATVCTLGL